jgi:flavin reductase (DIM6/NTAB) family NADH-FMN oxidoreductase RutF
LTSLVGNELPAGLYDRLSANARRNRGKVILILTVDSKGWPHIAMLSHWEVLARDRKNVGIATYASSNTSKNLRRTGKTTIVVTDRKMAYYVKGMASPEGLHRSTSNRIFNVRVKQVLEDKLPGSEIETGITYVEEEVTEPHQALRRELAKF